MIISLEVSPKKCLWDYEEASFKGGRWDHVENVEPWHDENAHEKPYFLASLQIPRRSSIHAMTNSQFRSQHAPSCDPFSIYCWHTIPGSSSSVVKSNTSVTPAAFHTKYQQVRALEVEPRRRLVGWLRPIHRRFVDVVATTHVNSRAVSWFTSATLIGI